MAAMIKFGKKKSYFNAKILIIIVSAKFLLLMGILIFVNKNKELNPDLHGRNTGEISPVWLGVQVLLIDKTVAENFNIPFRRGILVRRVIDGSPAEKAGMAKGDIIRAIGRKRVRDTLQLRDIINKMLPEQEIRVVYIRKKKTRTARIRLEKPPAKFLTDVGSRLVYGVFPVVIPPTDKPYPYFYFGEEESECPEDE